MIFGIFYEIAIEARLLTGKLTTGKLTTGKLSTDKIVIVLLSFKAYHIFKAYVFTII
jgi:uncharacterized protein (DUF169 family)